MNLRISVFEVLGFRLMNFARHLSNNCDSKQRFFITDQMRFDALFTVAILAQGTTSWLATRSPYFLLGFSSVSIAVGY
jgi:hypothetical protein